MVGASWDRALAKVICGTEGGVNRYVDERNVSRPATATQQAILWS